MAPACCESCALGRRCESECLPDTVGEDPIPGGPGLIRLIGGVPGLVGVPGQNPPLDKLLPPGVSIGPSMIPGYLLASLPVTGLPANIPGAAQQVALTAIPADFQAQGAAFVLATLAAWKASPQGRSAGWQDPTAEVYLEYLKAAYAKGDPLVKALVNWLTSLNVAAGSPDWLTQQVSAIKKNGPVIGTSYHSYTKVAVGARFDPVKEGYR